MANKIDFGANTHVENSNNTEAFIIKFKKQIIIAVVAIIVAIAGLLLYQSFVKAPREERQAPPSLRVRSISTRSSLTRLLTVTAQAMLDL